MNTGYSYSKYWKTWSRVLKFDGSTSVEVNLTPINSSWPDADWDEEVRPIIIRYHASTSPAQGFKVVEELPTEIKEMMVEKLGEELVQRLLTEDFLPQIDWDKYGVNCNGGCPLRRCLIDEDDWSEDKEGVNAMIPWAHPYEAA
tara:strand:+ start:454 stop:885 length:432 start_codon:yes stop_codon:yes gene_type:complete